MLRKVKETDRKLFIRLAKDFYSSTAVSHSIPCEYFERTFNTALSGSPYTDCYIIESDGSHAGYCLVSLTYSNEAGGKTVWIEELYLLPQMRGKGLGRESLAEISALYPDAVRLRLEITRANAGARRLYESVGFRPLGYEQLVLDKDAAAQVQTR